MLYPDSDTELCMKTRCLCPTQGHKYGCRKVTETSVVELCYLSVEINISSSAEIVQLAKPKAIAFFFYLHDGLGQPF